MLVNSLNQTKTSFSHVFAHENVEITAIYTGLNYSNPVYYAFDTINGAPPLSFKSNGEAIEDYTISGNTVQNGTPTPSNPIDVVGCGTWDATNQSYKLPIDVNNTEYPIYLAQVQTTRRIKKLVLTGEESWTRAANSTFYGSFVNDYNKVSGVITICSHYIGDTNRTSTSSVADKSCCFRFDSEANTIYIRDTDISSATDFKSFLAVQYANGTPVTVWYVLATPETGTVNEPLQKIGTYVDTINYTQSGIAIPTINGTNTLTVSTTVLPSNIEATGRIKRII